MGEILEDHMDRAYEICEYCGQIQMHCECVFDEIGMPVVERSIHDTHRSPENS